MNRGNEQLVPVDNSEEKHETPSGEILSTPASWCWPRRWRGCRLGARARRSRYIFCLEPRQQFIAHRKLINSPSDGRGVFLHIVFDDAFVGVEIRVPGVRVVLDWIDAETNPRQACITERSIV